jgi:CRP-like cAMP-binding protein
METLIFLKKVPLFSNFQLEDLLKLKEITEEQIYQTNDIIIKEGESGSKAYIIVSGSVEVLKKIDDADKPLANLDRTAYFGEMAIIENEPRSATVKANEECLLLTIKGEEFREMIKHNADLSFHITKIFSRRYRDLMNTKG